MSTWPSHPEGSSFGIELAMSKPSIANGLSCELEAMLTHHALIPQNAVVVDVSWLPAGSVREFSSPPRNRESAKERLTKMLTRATKIVEKHNEVRR